jgi:hypothetical protein
MGGLSHRRYIWARDDDMTSTFSIILHFVTFPEMNAFLELAPD